MNVLWALFACIWIQHTAAVLYFDSAPECIPMAFDVQDLERSAASSELGRLAAMESLYLFSKSGEIYVLPAV
jgi:hypothetical protein